MKKKRNEFADAAFASIAQEIVKNKKWRKLLAGTWSEEQSALEQIAKRYKGERTSTGGGIYVTLIPLGKHAVAGVSAECVCLYRNSKLTDPYEIFWQPENDTAEGIVSLCG